MQISDVVCGITFPILEPHWSFSTGLPYLAFGPAAFVQFIMFSPVFWIATVIHFFLQDLYRQFIILYLAEVMVGMGEETVLVEVAAVHELEGSERDESIASAVSILNFEWPRSDTIRRRGLESSSKDLPCSLIIFVGGKRKVLGHAKVSKVPALPGELFVESVVVHPGLRGLGLGKLLMLKVRNADNYFYHSV